MSAHKSAYLVAAFLSILATRGLDAETLDPWRGWVAFKQFAREVAEEPDPGISVQLFPVANGGAVRLAFVRQVLEPIGDRLESVGGVICDFTFALRRRPMRDWRVWSFDYASFDRFVDVVEQHPGVSDLFVTRPLDSAVYWEEA
jgi:hypothetical protein